VSQADLSVEPRRRWRLPRPSLTDLRALVDVYATEMRIAVVEQFQYRVANYLYMIGMVAEPVIYLVVWSTVAVQQGGSVGGFTPGQFAAYFIVWTLVRNMNIVFTPYGWEWRIRQGELNGMLLRPIHPVTFDIGYFAGWKVVVIFLWLPIAVLLSAFFQPEFAFGLTEVLVFLLAIWGAYLIRTVIYWTLGMVSFWTTRVGPVFELVFMAELLLSGRLVPLALMPDWAQGLADLLPFKWTFGFPIETLVGGLSQAELLGGLAMQLAWIVAGSVVLRLVWRVAVRRYSAVGN
jgi:ABC-2 type transport system permease protein